MHRMYQGLALLTHGCKTVLWISWEVCNVQKEYWLSCWTVLPGWVMPIWRWILILLISRHRMNKKHLLWILLQPFIQKYFVWYFIIYLYVSIIVTLRCNENINELSNLVKTKKSYQSAYPCRVELNFFMRYYGSHQSDNSKP